MSNVLLISYDNDSHIPFFPINLFYLTGAMKQAGHQVGIWFQDIHHGREEELTRLLDNANFDVVGLGFVAGYYQYRKARAISEAVNKSKNRKRFNYVLGGHGPAAEAEFFLERFGADTVVIGDGERAMCDIAKTNCQGILEAGPSDQAEAPIGSYRDFPLDIYRLIRWPTSKRSDFCFPILSSRGCKFNCSFCYRMRQGMYLRPVEAIMEEIRYLHDHIQINHFQFADELLMASEDRTEEVCRSLSDLNIKIKWDCNGRLNYTSPKILKLMKRTGCEYINYGIESLDQTILNQMGKGLTLDRIVDGVRDTLQANISPGLNLLWGFSGDTVENLRKAVDFLLKYDPCHELRTIRPVTPYPGTPLYRKAIKEGLLDGPEDFYERKHMNSDLFTVNFMDMPTKQAHEELFKANEALFCNYLAKRKMKFHRQASKLYIEGDPSFRGFRDV